MLYLLAKLSSNLLQTLPIVKYCTNINTEISLQDFLSKGLTLTEVPLSNTTFSSKDDGFAYETKQ